MPFFLTTRTGGKLRCTVQCPGLECPFSWGVKGQDCSVRGRPGVWGTDGAEEEADGVSP